MSKKINKPNEDELELDGVVDEDTQAQPLEEEAEEEELKPTGKYYAKKGVVIGPDGKVFRTYTKEVHPKPEEAAQVFAAKMNTKLAGAHQ